MAFRFRLARDLRMTVEELEERVSAHEFLLWTEYYASEARAQERAQRKAEQKASRARR